MQANVLAAALGVGLAGIAQAQIADQRLDTAIAAIEQQVIAWRRDIHQNPELGNREFRTTALVAEHLGSLGFEVKTGIAHTGVAGVLRGGRPGPVVALRADMDALPVTEQNDLPFRSTVTTEYAGQQVGVMHACGHDTHVAMLMGIAQVLSGMRADLPGTVMVIFQPAEEGPPAGEEGGAELMLKEGLFDELRPDAVLGMHAMTNANTGTIQYRSGPFLAAADTFSIRVQGVQTHGAIPWAGVDPIVVAAQVVLGLQTIVSRQANIVSAPAILTLGTIHGGNRFNIIPQEVEMAGTLRSFDEGMRADVLERMRRTAGSIAAASGAKAELTLGELDYPVTVNDAALTLRVLPSLRRAIGEANVLESALVTASEDFSHYANQVPGFFFMVGMTPPGRDPTTAAANHSPLFQIDEAALAVGMKAMLYTAVDYLHGK
jgi:amidohydrolase